MEAYCVKCKAKREIVNPTPAYMKNARPTTKGTCPVCGTNIQRIGLTPEHAGVPAPAAEIQPPKVADATAPKKRGKK